MYNRFQIVALAKSLNQSVVEVIALMRKMKVSFTLNLGLDKSLRGGGNASLRRIGEQRPFSFSCSCESSPCQHEFCYEAVWENRELHRARRGVKTRLAKC